MAPKTAMNMKAMKTATKGKAKAIHASHTLQKVHSHPEALYCTRCGAYNNGGPLRTLKAKCSGVLAPAHAAQHRLLECGIMPAPGARLPNSSRKWQQK